MVVWKLKSKNKNEGSDIKRKNVVNEEKRWEENKTEERTKLKKKIHSKR